MKITALIADDNCPQGRPEVYTATKHDADEVAARKQTEGYLAIFNADLRPGELPRRIISVHVEEMELDDAWNMGLGAYHKGSPIEANYWPESHPNHDEWRNGWESAEHDDSDEDDSDDE